MSASDVVQDAVEQQLQYLQQQLQAMPPVAAMQICVQGLHAGRLQLCAPLQANLNDKGNAFGGSLASLMTLAGWGWLSLHLRLAGQDADVYVADSQLRYLLPVYQQLRAEAGMQPGSDWEGFIDTLRQRGRARITLQAQVGLDSGQPAATFSGKFVAIAKA